MRIKTIMLLLLCIVILWADRPVFAQEVKKVHIVDEPYPPYTIGEYGGPATGGIGVEIIRELFQRLGVEVEIDLVPWKRVLKMAEVGQADGTGLLMRSLDRERYLAFTDAVLEVRELFYYRSDRMGAFEWKTFSDLKGYTISLVDGYSYDENFLKAVDRLGLKVERAESSALACRKLYAGRVDLLLENESAANALIAKNKTWKGVFKTASKPVSTFNFHLAFSKRSPAVKLLPAVNRVIAEMKQDGTIDRIAGQTD